MKPYIKFLVTLIAIGMLALNGCAQNPTPTATSEIATATSTRPATPSTLQTSRILQLQNNLPQTRLSPRSSQELEDNHIGIHAEDFGRYTILMEQVRRNGFKWIRIQSLTDFWGGEGYEPLTFSLESIPPEVDSAINGYIANGVNIVLDLVLGSGVKINYTKFNTTFQSQEEIDRYLEHVKFVVSHFKGRIQYYQILNEPGYITVETYANLIRQVVPVIREIDPDAKIIIGGMWGRWENGYPGYGEYQRFSLAVDYLNELLRSGVVDMVDVISWHPLYDNIPGDPYYQDIPQIVQSIKDLAASQGFTGEYFADEILWQTVDEPDWDNGPPVTSSIAGKYFTRAITEHRGLGINVTINTWFIEPENGNAPKGALTPIQNLCDTLAGAEPTSVTLSLETKEDANMRHYAFVLPNGDRLLALWTNDEAVEEDPGVNTTLKLPGSSAQGVTGIDVFYGFEQELVTETENGNLVIRNLLVKDYPIILRFVGPHFAQPLSVEPTKPPVEPVTIKLRRDAQERLPAGTPIQLTIGWLTDTQAQVADYLDAINVTGILDGQPLPDLNGYWGRIEPYTSGGYISQWLYPLGVLSPGTHTIEIRGTLSRPVTDGYDTNKDGQLDQFSGEVWQFTIVIEVY